MQTLCQESGLRTAQNWQKDPKNDNGVTIFWHDVIVKLFWRCFISLVKFSDWSKFHINIIAGSGIMTIFFYKGCPEIRQSEISQSEFCPISGDCSKLWIPNLAGMSLIECYWMLKNVMVTAFAVFELLRENQLGGEFSIPHSHTQIRVKLGANQASWLTVSWFRHLLVCLRYCTNLRKLLNQVPSVTDLSAKS